MRLVRRSTIACAFAELVRVVEVGEVAAGEAGVGVDQRLDDLGVDLVADVALALERDHVLEARALRNDDRRGEVVAVAVFVGDVLDEQHEQDVVLVLAGIHAAAQFIAGGPEGGVEVGFLDGHRLFCCRRRVRVLTRTRGCCSSSDLLRIAKYSDETRCLSKKLNRHRFPSPQRGRGARGEGASTQLIDPAGLQHPHPALSSAS